MFLFHVFYVILVTHFLQTVRSALLLPFLPRQLFNDDPIRQQSAGHINAILILLFMFFNLII